MKKLALSLILALAMLAGLTGCGKEEPIIGPIQEDDKIQGPLYELTMTNTCNFVVKIYIDNQDRGIIQPVQKQSFMLTEGAHLVTMEGAGQSSTNNYYMSQNFAITTCSTANSFTNDF